MSRKQEEVIIEIVFTLKYTILLLEWLDSCISTKASLKKDGSEIEGQRLKKGHYRARLCELMLSKDSSNRRWE